MRNRILGLVGVLWGGIILLSRLQRGASQGGGAYQSGQTVGVVFAAVLLIVGAYYLIRGSGSKDRGTPAAGRRRPPPPAAPPETPAVPPVASSARPVAPPVRTATPPVRPTAAAVPPVASAGGREAATATRTSGPRAAAEPTLRWSEPLGYRVLLRGDMGLRLLTAGGAWALATGVLCGLFAINVNPPGVVVAIFLGAVFGLGPSLLLLFLRKSDVSGRMRADQSGLQRLRFYAGLTEMWTENTTWPYEALSEAVIIPAAALGKTFSLLLLTTTEKTEMVALPRRLDRDSLIRLLASKGVEVRVGRDISAAWRRPLARPLAVSSAAIGLVVLLGGAGFYLLRGSGRQTAGSRPLVPETPLPEAALAVPGDTRPRPRDDSARAAAGGAPSAERPAAPTAAPGGGAPRAVGGQGNAGAPPGTGLGAGGGPARPPGAAPGAPGAPGWTPPGGGGVAGQPGAPAAAGGPPLGAPGWVAPGAGATPGQPGDSELVGGPGGFPFRLAGAPSKPALGFHYIMGSWAGQPALSAFEPLAEPQQAGPGVVSARAGYAVGALKVDASTLVNAVQVVFMKILPDGRLDPRDAYNADWIGRPSGRPPKVLGGTGQPVIGVQGRRGAVIDAIGLVLAP